MTIRRSSWHYRLYRFIQNLPKGPRYLNPFAKVEREDAPPPSSLCPYAWMIFLGIIGMITLALVGAVGGIIFLPFWLLYKAAAWVDAHVRMPKFKLVNTAKREKEPRTRRESLVVAFVKAKKNKVCPPVRLVD